MMKYDNVIFESISRWMNARTPISPNFDYFSFSLAVISSSSEMRISLFMNGVQRNLVISRISLEHSLEPELYISVAITEVLNSLYNSLRISSRLTTELPPTWSQRTKTELSRPWSSTLIPISKCDVSWTRP